jgi:hypothetical protein
MSESLAVLPCTCGLDVVPTDEAVLARNERLVLLLRAVLKLVDRKQHMFMSGQYVLNEADAMLVEMERVK